MSEQSKGSQEPARPDFERLGAELNLLTALCLILTLALVVLSMCFTQLLRRQNASWKKQEKGYLERAQGNLELNRFGQRLIVELAALRDKEPEVGRLLQENQVGVRLFGPFGEGG